MQLSLTSCLPGYGMNSTALKTKMWNFNACTFQYPTKDVQFTIAVLLILFFNFPWDNLTIPYWRTMYGSYSNTMNEWCIKCNHIHKWCFNLSYTNTCRLIPDQPVLTLSSENFNSFLFMASIQQLHLMLSRKGSDNTPHYVHLHYVHLNNQCVLKYPCSAFIKIA